MIATDFFNILMSVGFFVAFFGAAALACWGLFTLGYRMGDWGEYNVGLTLKRLISIAIPLFLLIPITTVFILVFNLVLEGEDETTFSVSGGLGPDTVCWYQVVDDDTVISTGKTVVVIDGSEKRTVCNLIPEAIPKEVLTGGE